MPTRARVYANMYISNTVITKQLTMFCFRWSRRITPLTTEVAEMPIENNNFSIEVYKEALFILAVKLREAERRIEVLEDNILAHADTPRRD